MTEHYIGVDLHKAFFQACAVTTTGEQVWEDRFPRTPAGIAAFLERCSARTAVAVEASTPTWHFADAIAAVVSEVRIVDALKTRLKAGYAAKTDRLDARRLADAFRRDSVVGIYCPPVAIRELRELCRGRHTLVQQQTRLIQRIRALLLRHGLVEARRLVKTDAALDRVTLPPQAGASLAALRRVLALVRTEIAGFERAVRQGAVGDPIVAALQAIAGIGPVLALLIRAEIGDIRRFPTANHLASYAGLVPRVEASAGRYRYGRITRRGSPWLRWALIEAAIHGVRRPDASGRWARRLALRKGALKARVAMARSMCTDVFTAWMACA
jgi:transposase